MLSDVLKFPLPTLGQGPRVRSGRESYAAGPAPANEGGDALLAHLAELLAAGVTLLGAAAGAVYVRLPGERYHLAASVGLDEAALQRRRRRGPPAGALEAAPYEAHVAPIDTARDDAWGVIELDFVPGALPHAERLDAWLGVVRQAGWMVERHRRATLWEELAAGADEGEIGGLGDTPVAGWPVPARMVVLGDGAEPAAVVAHDRERPREVAHGGPADVARREEPRDGRLEHAVASLARATHVHEVARELVRQASVRLDVAGAVVLQRAPGSGDLASLASRGATAALLAGARTVPLDSPLAVAEAARTGRAVVRDGEPHGRERVVALPLRTADDVPAVLGVVLGDGRELAAADRELLRALARVGGQALERARLHEAAHAAPDRELLRALARVGGQALERARLHEAAHAASQAKSDFLAMMSHELRTPLNAIIGYSGLIADEVVGPVNPTQHEQLHRVQEHARHLLTLIEEMLTLSQAETGQERVREEPVDPGALLREVVALLEPAAARKGLTLTAVVEPGVLPAVTDADKVRQVLAHLLTNAIKFTAAGEVEARVQEDRSGEQRVLQFEVSDTGVGIAPQHLERIFEPFWQADQSRAHRVAGTGLGLNVTRRLAYLLGGEVSVTSAPGHGSTFVLRVPVKS